MHPEPKTKVGRKKKKKAKTKCGNCAHMAVLFLCNYALELGWYSTSVQVFSKPELDTFRKGRDKGTSRSFSFAAFWLHLTRGSVVQHLLDAEVFCKSFDERLNFVIGGWM